MKVFGDAHRENREVERQGVQGLFPGGPQREKVPGPPGPPPSQGTRNRRELWLDNLRRTCQMLSDVLISTMDDEVFEEIRDLRDSLEHIAIREHQKGR